jgi:hypothetical protein
MKAKCIDHICGLTLNEEYNLIKISNDQVLIYSNHEFCWYPRDNFKIIPDKILTDQMIKDILDCYVLPNPYDDYCKIIDHNLGKEHLKNRGYDVEEPKTKLDEAKELKEYMQKEYSFSENCKSDFIKLYSLYESYIEELKRS